MKLRNTMIALGALALVLSFAGFARATAPSYNVVDLGPLPNSQDNSGVREDVSGCAVNDLGQVAGYGTQYHLGVAPPTQFGFLWTNGTYSTFSGSLQPQYGLNNSGQVAVPGTPDYVWSAEWRNYATAVRIRVRGFLWRSH